MKIYARSGVAALIVFAALMTAPAQAQLLGGLLGGGDGDGGVVGGLLGGGNSGGGGGLLGGDGGLVGNGGLVDLDTSGDSTIGATGVATITFGGGDSGNGSITVLGGGGGNDLDLPLGLLGGNGTGIDLPGLGNIIGGPGAPGQPGAPGAPGRPGLNGSNGGGSNGINGTGINGRNGGPGGVFTFNTNSSKLKLLAAILQNRAWLRFAAGSGICLPGYGVADVTSWVPQKDWNQMQQIVANYAQDIYTLRTMLAKCRGGSKVGSSVANRAIGVDIQNGMPVVFVL